MIEMSGDVDLSLEYVVDLDLEIDRVGLVSKSLEIDNVFVDGRGTEYEGPYTVRPDPDENIVLPTYRKRMAGNVTVEKIPYYQTTNVAGGYTAIIGD